MNQQQIGTASKKVNMKKPRPKHLTDYYNQRLAIGDLVLGAVPGGKYGKTTYKHSLVIGRTDHMILVHQVQPFDTTHDIMRSLELRGRQGGRITPAEVIRVSQGVLTEKTIEQALSKGGRTPAGHPLPLVSVSSSISGQAFPFNFAP